MKKFCIVLLTLPIPLYEAYEHPDRHSPPPLPSWRTSKISDREGEACNVEDTISEYDGPSNAQHGMAKPMRTLEKLQDMLDETDYLTDRRSLWASRDRMKYKKQQKKFRKMEDVEPASDDTTDDGLGYTLPDLPIYNSDVEEETNAEDLGEPQGMRYQPKYETLPSNSAALHQDKQQPVPTHPAQPPAPPQENDFIPSQVLTPPHAASYYAPISKRTYPSASQTLRQGSYIPHRHSRYPHSATYQNPGLQNNRYQSYPYPPPPQQEQHQTTRQTYQDPSVPTETRERDPSAFDPVPPSRPYPQRKPSVSLNTQHQSSLSPPGSTLQVSEMSPYPIMTEQDPGVDGVVKMTNTERLVEASTDITMGSILKLSHLALVSCFMAYAAVSPRSLPLTDYNFKFYENMRLLLLTGIGPAVYMLSVFDARLNDINAVTHSFFATISFGYLLTFVIEILSTTVMRLVVFCIFERGVFSLTPQIPIPILPWVLKDQHYRPKRITILVADFLTSCVLCPIIEETIKLVFLQWTVNLPKNFRWRTKMPSKRKRKRRVAESIVRKPGESDCVNANPYVTHMLAVSLALKLADVSRRVLLYTKDLHSHKSSYAIFRGLFPIQELCGIMTALALAKRDLLGFHVPLWKLLGPAVVVHGMANFRGMKLLKKGYAKLMWLIILSRVLGYCIKNYFMLNRQATKRTTKYAGNHPAFFAELTTAETLKSQKKK